MKTKSFFYSLLIVLLPLFCSCDDDGYSIGDFGVDWATVHLRGDGGYYLDSDNFGTLVPLAYSDYLYERFRPKEGDRIIAYFNPLYDDYQGYDLAIKLEGVHTMLVKPVQEMTTETEEFFGNDPVAILEGYIWLGKGYLNLMYEQNYTSTKLHRMSLVRNMEKEYPDDGYCYLELRYNNNNDDVGSYSLNVPISFNLLGYYPEENNGVFKGFKILINSVVSGEKTVVLDMARK